MPADETGTGDHPACQNRGMPILPGAQPYRHDGDDVGVLVCHGFIATPQSVRPLAVHLADAGHTVRLPRLPGHGTTWQECNKTRWEDWYAVVDREFRALRSQCRTVVLAGLSMGATLATRLAEEHGPGVDGLILINPAFRVDDPRMKILPVLQRAVPSLGAIGDDRKMVGGEPELCYDRLPLKALYSQTQLWKKTVEDLPEVTVPILLMRSDVDHVVPRSSGDLFLSRVGSNDIREIPLHDSYHVATLDNDAALINDAALTFVEDLARVRR
jgi:carboxylesterase